MRTAMRALGATLAASLLLAGAVSSASARIISSSNQNIRVTWASLEFSGSVTIRCPVTFEGSFHARTIAKVARSLIGFVTRASIGEAEATDTITGRANREVGGAITTLEPVAGRNTITLERTIGGLCPGSGRMLGSGSVTVLNNNNRVTVTLI
jgi:hypothetical protein